MFYGPAIGPRVRAAARALLGAALAAFGALPTPPRARSARWSHHQFIVVAVFALATLVLAAIAAYQAATTPRVSFADSYAEGSSE